MSWRTAQKVSSKLTPLPQTPTVTDDLCTWFVSQPAVGEDAWLLAYAEDGVIWGKLTNGQLQLSSEIWPERVRLLRHATLREARLFGVQAEVHLWHSEQGWQACRIEDQPGMDDAFDEEHRLWGNRLNAMQQGFSFVSETGMMGAYAVPFELPEDAFAPARAGFDTYRPLLLTCRHYLAYAETTGEAYIARSRLVNLHVEPYGAFKKRRAEKYE